MKVREKVAVKQRKFLTVSIWQREEGIASVN